jgi:hypothetical protein
MKYVHLLIGLSLFFNACKQKDQKKAQKEELSSIVKRTFIQPIEDNLEAHGGLELWNSFNSLTFERPTDSGPVKHIIDLKSRNETISKDTTYSVGYLDNKTWVLPDSSAFINARFYKNLHFYFFALPFMAADSGVIHEYLGQKKFNGKLYDIVKFSYGENVGDSPEDRYILYINFETKVLDMINYSVTYFDQSRGEKYNAIIYEEWQTINGLLLPKSFSGYKWENDTIGDKRYNAIFNNVNFDRTSLSTDMFEAPKDAYVE